MKQTISLIMEDEDKGNIFFSTPNLQFTKGLILAGDIGGTKTNLTSFKLDQGILIQLIEKSFFTRDFQSFQALLQSFMKEEKELPEFDCICIGVAGPVINGKVSGTNFPWELDEKKIKKFTGVAHIYLINDMEANAYGLSVLKREEKIEIKSGAGIGGNMALISPGTGLGEAGIFWDGRHYYPFATEGGHCDFGPRNEQDIALLKFLQNRYDHVSWERIISGPGIYSLYQFLVKDKADPNEPDLVREKLAKNNPSVIISECAKENKGTVYNEAMDLFFRYLAIETAQVALKFKATGGIFIGGGILPKVIELLDKDIFLENFLKVGRMNSLLEKIPIYVITNVNSPINGAAFYAAIMLSK